ncbi:MAG TPA: DUF488 domain-containing protein [Burkholderiales bacterium]|nr:DUF488 domain-containing protein [Burkholderiales bacterium]
MTVLFSVGHGNRTSTELLQLLQQAGIQCLADVRAYPASRRHPQFARAALERLLAETGIRYQWEGRALGGRRKPRNDSPHTALRNANFRAYADHMLTAEFQQALDRLLALASGERIAIMCAERLPWQCHRYLIADSAVARGVEVMHLVEPGKRQEHRLNSAARVEGCKLFYDRNEQFEFAV